MREPIVVDTNVLVTAENVQNRACARNCASRLAEIELNGQVVLDYRREILSEYERNLRGVRQPQAGFQFWKWLVNTKANSDHCVWITTATHATRGYEEFPAHDGLKEFDPADRKFVAVANAHPAKPPIVQATDSKWVGWRKALAECGIQVEFVCRDEIEEKYEKKTGKHAPR